MRKIVLRDKYSKTIRTTVIAALAAVFIAGACFYGFYMVPRYTVPILMYHGVAEDKDGTLFVTPRNFERQMRFLSENRYKVISLDEYVNGVNAGKSFPRKTVIITFDDGYEDNYVNAFPVLSRYGMPATIFLATASISKDKEYLTWDQVNLMAKNGVDFGGHTRNHVYLPSISDPKTLWDEIFGAKSDIEKGMGKAPDYFCFPSGGHSDRIDDAVKKAGYKAACTTNRGKDRLNHDVYHLNRVKITDSDTNKPLHLRAKLSGYYNLFRRIKGNADY
jgi:peptidoglycan/xylan/chitin deacetylase (PgdA/CDA1 family)